MSDEERPAPPPESRPESRSDSRRESCNVEGVHFYREGPYVVFTELYLRERGYCCESGCRHCPWGYRRDVRSDVPVDS